jgi:hypothetical protein
MKGFCVLLFIIFLAGCNSDQSVVKGNDDLHKDYNLTGTVDGTSVKWMYKGTAVTSSSSYINAADMHYMLKIQIGDKKYEGEINYTFNQSGILTTSFQAVFNIKSESNQITGNIINTTDNPTVHNVNLTAGTNNIKGTIIISNQDHYYQIDSGVKLNGKRFSASSVSPPSWDMTINKHFIKGQIETKDFNNYYYLKTDINEQELLLFLLLDITYVPVYNNYLSYLKYSGRLFK